MNMLCSRCKQRMAMIFVSKIENGQPVNEGYCIQCARELRIPQVQEMIDKQGMSEDDIENISDHMREIFGTEGDFEPGGAMPIPSFLQNFMTSLTGGDDSSEEGESTELIEPPQPAKSTRERERERPKREKGKARKFLDQYCDDLTQKAREGKLDRIVGRDKEIYRVMQILNRRQKITPVSSVSRASAKQPSPRALHSGWLRAMCRPA